MPGVPDMWGALDYCDGDYLLKTYCKNLTNEDPLLTGGVLFYERHLCEYGCEENRDGNGYCLSAPKVCADLNQTLKNKIIELQNAGKKVFLVEGNSFVEEGMYTVISQGGYSRILSVEEVRKNVTSKWIYLKDVINNESLNFVFNQSQTEVNMSLIIDGQKYYVYPDFMLVRDTTLGSILITWGNGASNELLVKGIGTETTISCPKACKNGICLDCLENWTCKDWGNNCTNNWKTRDCTDLNKCGTTKDKPSENQRCFCTENWICEDWIKCTNKMTKKNCTDLNKCGTISYKPLTFRNCTSEELSKGEIIEGSINNTKIIFERDSNGIKTLKTNNFFVNSFLNITQESEKLYAMTSSGNKEIKILPEEAILKFEEINKINNITLKEYNGEIVYTISGIKNTKLFFIFPLSEKIEMGVNAGNTLVMFVKRPWWHFLLLVFE